MEIKEIQRKKKTERKISISVRIPKSYSDFMTEKNISPTALVLKSLDELMKKAK